MTANTGSVAGNIGVALRTVLPTNVTIAVLSPLVVAEMLVRAFTAAGTQVFLPSILLTMFLGAVLRRRDKKALLEIT
ncbi:MAG: hypothetical protein HKO76_06490 [Acidimicrobiia bacterium]|nr:hypothetical protein [Acidimicrobiia bacterium]